MMMNHRVGQIDVVAGVRRYFYGMQRTRLLLLGTSVLLLVVGTPIDILRQQYVWSGQGGEKEPYRVLVGHCECFVRDSVTGQLPDCVRAYSLVWTGSTLLQLALVLLLLLPEGQHGKLQLLLSAAYFTVVILLCTLFIDCGALTEDDCYLMYLLLPLLIHACLMLWSVSRMLVVQTIARGCSSGRLTFL